ncbi:MAG: N-acetylmuramoyl-L-alanine amidase-like domain-containing protein [Bacteroidales bacterium]
MKKTLFSIALSFLVFTSFAQEASSSKVFQTDRPGIYYQPEDRFVFDRYIDYIFDKRNLPTDQLVIETAKFFVGVPYVGYTLEIEPEGLVIDLQELDCTTFVENVFALAMTVKSRDLNFDNFCNQLRWLRYREGVINDYTDRLHYTSDWIYTNQHKGIVKDVSRRAGGERIDFNLYIMSSNTDQYKQLKGKEDLINKVKAKESEINSRKHFFLPTDKIDINAKRIHSGDMLGFVTTIPGIDISHVGIIYKEGDKLTFIHASSTQKKVVINQVPLTEYIKEVKKNTGIVLVRAKF